MSWNTCLIYLDDIIIFSPEEKLFEGRGRCIGVVTEGESHAEDVEIRAVQPKGGIPGTHYITWKAGCSGLTNQENPGDAVPG